MASKVRMTLTTFPSNIKIRFSFFRKNATQMGLSPTPTLSIARRMTKMIQGRAHSKEIMSMGFMSRRPENTTGV